MGSPFGKGLFVCQNKDFVQGYMDEHLIFFGNANGDHLEGNYYDAGTGNCATGTFELERTKWGIEGYLVCGGNGRVIPLSEVRSSEFRAPDDDEGDDDDETVQGSLQRISDDGTVHDEFV